MIRFFNAFVKLTGWPAAFLCFRTKVFYEDRVAQSRRIRGRAILISNHTAVYDYAVYLFVFFTRTLRFQMAELLFRKPVLGKLLKALGGIRVDRDSYDFGFVETSLRVLEKGGVVGVFPESRLPREGEEKPLPFKPSAAYLALSSGAPVIPLYTNGSYFRKKRAEVMIGRPVFAADLTDPALSDRENLDRVSRLLRQRVMELGEKLEERNR